MKGKNVKIVKAFTLKKGLHNALFSFVIFFYHIIKGKCKNVSLNNQSLFFFKYFPKKRRIYHWYFSVILYPIKIGVKIHVRIEMDYKMPTRWKIQSNLDKMDITLICKMDFEKNSILSRCILLVLSTYYLVNYIFLFRRIRINSNQSLIIDILPWEC